MLLKIASISISVLLLISALYVLFSVDLYPEEAFVMLPDSSGFLIAGEDYAQGAIVNATQSLTDPKTVLVQREADSEKDRMLGDLSRVTVTFDGYGNKTETRVFRGDSRLRMVMIQTTVGGDRIAYVYGHIGGVKTLTGEKAELGLSGTADQLAAAAEIFETRLDKERRRPQFARNNKGESEPLDSSEIEFDYDSFEEGSEGPAEGVRPADDDGNVDSVDSEESEVDA